jgi:hypothetical protein
MMGGICLRKAVDVRSILKNTPCCGELTAVIKLSSHDSDLVYHEEHDGTEVGG